jgi:tRNA (guanine37-N1)-methyltransferase
MFAGVGPYSILVAKKQPTATVHAVDVNPVAFRFLMSNILLNKVHKNVRAAMGDIRKIVSSNLFGTADRAIMNLPGKAHDFVDVACLSIRKNGGIIHFYSFEKTEDWQEAALAKLNERVEASGRRVKDVLATRIVKEIAPYRVQVAVDARVS